MKKITYVISENLNQTNLLSGKKPGIFWLQSAWQLASCTRSVPTRNKMVRDKWTINENSTYIIIYMNIENVLNMWQATIIIYPLFTSCFYLKQQLFPRRRQTSPVILSFPPSPFVVSQLCNMQPSTNFADNHIRFIST